MKLFTSKIMTLVISSILSVSMLTGCNSSEHMQKENTQEVMELTKDQQLMIMKTDFNFYTTIADEFELVERDIQLACCHKSDEEIEEGLERLEILINKIENYECLDKYYNTLSEECKTAMIKNMKIYKNSAIECMNNNFDTMPRTYTEYSNATFNNLNKLGLEIDNNY